MSASSITPAKLEFDENEQIFIHSTFTVVNEISSRYDGGTLGSKKPMYPVGTRVGAILSANETSVSFLGYGTYEGDLPYPDSPTLQEVVPEWDTLTEAQQTAFQNGYARVVNNPCIKLDNGDTVWGRECWWGPEPKIKEIMGDKTVINVRMVRGKDGVTVENA
jgi:hypothetical protein